jgi:hypothetical protein
MDPTRDEKVHRGAGGHENEKAAVPPAVEDVARHEEKNILGPALLQAPIRDNHEDEKRDVDR